MKTITFLLTQIPKLPVGGFKVPYEYANRLVADGYRVRIVYPNINALHKFFFRNRCIAILRFIIRKYINKDYFCNWFKLDSRVEEIFSWSLEEKHVPMSDIYVATGVDTAYILHNYKHVATSNMWYLIQGFENWEVDDESVKDTYRFGMKNIVISHWLKDIVYEIDKDVALIPNGFDFDFFRCTAEITERRPFKVVMMYHTDWRKGCDIAFAALRKVKEIHPELEVNVFSAYDKPEDLPAWCHFFKRPDKKTFNKLYNESAIYVAASNTEGWGLTVGEAMQCGCAVACTDTLGFLEMVTNEETGLISPIGDVQALEKNIIRLMEDDDLRIRLALAGYENIQKFAWEKSYEKLKKLIN